MATKPQVKLLRDLAKQKRLRADDCGDPRWWRFKEEMPADAASRLIRLGLDRRHCHRADKRMRRMFEGR